MTNIALTPHEKLRASVLKENEEPMIHEEDDFDAQATASSVLNLAHEALEALNEMEYLLDETGARNLARDVEECTKKIKGIMFSARRNFADQ